ncbi:glycosyltransferase, partial [Helicobacter sp. MIT 14-3879]|uniref:glycosyltransferase n=1 Tax=Helicobacter sp. MIT 14-3879 TaxID=2040649 RepID=UPI000E38BF2A
MKILLTIADISITGGGERVVVNLANAFISMGYNVEILSFYRANKTLPYNIKSNLTFLYNLSESSLKKIYFNNILKRFYFKNIFKFLLSFKIKNIYKDIDIIIANDWIYTPFFKNKNTKYIKILHLNFKFYNKRNSYFDTLVLLTNNEYHKYRLYHPNIKVIPNFIPEIPLEVSNLDNNNVLSVGRMD